MGIPFAVIAVIIVGIVIRLAAGVCDKSRIAEYIESLGGTLLNCRWAPFGPGWVGERDSRLYAISYSDAAGVVHGANVKTSLWGGVYLTNDRVVGETLPQPGPESVEDEKARLRRRLAELEARDP